MLSLDENPSSTSSLSSPIKSARKLLEGKHRQSHHRAQERQQALIDQLKAQRQTEGYLRMMPRPWSQGNVYAPRDLSPAEMRKWRTIRPSREDVVDILGINPLDLYRVRISRS
jgi:small subunit ribosomal protein S18